MVRNRRSSSIILVGMVALLLVSLFELPRAAKAASTPKGLEISPATDYPSLDAGSQSSRTLAITNNTPSPMVVALSVKQFSVANYTYQYNFSDPANDWLKLDLTKVELAPGQRASVPYRFSVPAGTSPGGYYFTVIASATVKSGDLVSTVQAASLIYLTVNGELVRTSHLVGQYIQRWAIASQIHYHFNVINTGNVYYFIYVSGSLRGLDRVSAVTHIVMPGKVRTFSGTIALPIWPGIYRATYGYTTDNGSSITESKLVVYTPPWFLVILIALSLGIVATRGSKRRNRRND